MQLYSAARANLKRGIRQAKIDYRQKIEDNFKRQVWCSIQNITNHRPNLTAVNSEPKLAKKLHFFQPLPHCGGE